MFQSNGTKGAHPLWLKEFVKHNDIVHSLGFVPTLSADTEDKIFKRIVTDHAGEGYDFKALWFWFAVGLRRKLFKTPIPEKNAWGKDGYNLCTGLISPLQKYMPEYFWGPNIDWEMLSPASIFELLSDRPEFYNG